MTKFNLVVRDHFDFGSLGVVIENNHRDYFEPAIDGSVVAHDIIEHPKTPHSDGFIDEYIALGGVFAGRICCGWYTPEGRNLDIQDIESDIQSLVYNAICLGNDICVEECKSTLKDKKLVKNIRKAVENGVIEGYSDASDGEDTPAEYLEKIDSITGWICKGIQLFNKRFKNTFDVSTYVFNRITFVVDEWMKTANEYDRAVLNVNFTTCEVYLNEV
jgi:hypothetical protein